MFRAPSIPSLARGCAWLCCRSCALGQRWSLPPGSITDRVLVTRAGRLPRFEADLVKSTAEDRCHRRCITPALVARQRKGFCRRVLPPWCRWVVTVWYLGSRVHPQSLNDRGTGLVGGEDARMSVHNTGAVLYAFSQKPGSTRHTHTHTHTHTHIHTHTHQAPTWESHKYAGLRAAHTTCNNTHCIHRASSRGMYGPIFWK